MGIIWIIEKPNKGALSLAAKLQGDFAVRLIGSLDTYVRLSRLQQKPLPDALIIDCDDQDDAFAEIETKALKGLPHALRLFVFQEKGRHVQAAQHPLAYAVKKDFCSLEFVNELRNRLSERQSRGHQLLQYRNLELDFENFLLRIHPENEEVSLPVKEARILKYMMENPRQCLGREQLKEAVWGTLAVSPRTIDSHISRLRKRLSFAAIDIQNVYGGGYILE